MIEKIAQFAQIEIDIGLIDFSILIENCSPLV